MSPWLTTGLEQWDYFLCLLFSKKEYRFYVSHHVFEFSPTCIDTIIVLFMKWYEFFIYLKKQVLLHVDLKEDVCQPVRLSLFFLNKQFYTLVMYLSKMFFKKYFSIF